MAYFVFNGARLKCSMGDMESFLEVFDPKGEGFVCGEKAANIKDCKPLINIPPFGMCQSLQNPSVASATAANYGKLQPMPCMVPNIVGDEWKNWGKNSGMYIRGHPVLLKEGSFLNCVFQGIIEITEDYGEGIETGALGLEEDLMKDPEWIGPGTQYINDSGRLLYQRGDGFSGNVRIVLDKDIPLLEQKLRKAKMNGTLHDPDNGELLSIGMTGEQYTVWKAGNIPWDMVHYEFKKGYYAGYENDILAQMSIEANALGASGAVSEFGAPDDTLSYAFTGKDGIRAGKYDRANRLIDAYNPTARIIGPPLMNI